MSIPSEDVVARVSAAIALGACVLLYLESRLPSRPAARTVRLAGGALAVASVVTYFHFLMIPAGSFYHRWEMFHYFIGAKYAPELGYEGLYACTAVAEAEQGRDIAQRLMRDLRDDSLVRAELALRDPQACKRSFTNERWSSFRGDVEFFRALAGTPAYWAQMQTDHGYNPSPVWTLTGRALSEVAPLSRSFLRALALVDPLLMGLAVGALGWAFGVRTALVAIVFWGTQAPSSFTWTGGAFLRQDWLLLAALALAFLRKRWLFAAGFCLAWAALLRVFPILLWAGPLLLASRDLVRTRRLAREASRLIAGGACAAALLLPAGAVAAGGVQQYESFAVHLYMHSRTPIVNHMSLRTLMSFTPSSRLAELVEPDAVDPGARWADAKRATIDRVRPWYVASAALVLLGFALVGLRLHTPWLALALSIVLIAAVSDPSCYYHSYWLLAAPLALARPTVELLLVALAAASQLIALQLRHVDDRFVALSLLYVTFGCLLLALFARRRRKPSAQALASSLH